MVLAERVSDLLVWLCIRMDHLSGIKDSLVGINKKTATVAVLALGGTLWLGNALLAWNRLQNGRRKGAWKRDKRHRQIEDYKKRLTADKRVVQSKDHITGLSMHELLDELRSGTMMAVDVLKAYQLKAIEAHEKTNCLIEFIEEAEEMAIAFDNSSENSGLLGGLPISIKEDVCMKGYDCTAGCYKFINMPAEDEPGFLKVLKLQGAIPFARTNIPQLMISVEGSNPVYGMVTNPHDSTRTPGGSSSGEAALIASGGSIAGIGSDGGGSLRIPASYVGICSFKATYERISTKGNPYYAMESACVHPVWGPLARDVDSIVLIMRALWSEHMNNLDVLIPPMLFNEERYAGRGPLTIGYYTRDLLLTAVPAMARAVHIAKEMLEKQGHKLVAWDPPPAASECIEWQYETCVGCDGGKEVREILEDEDIDDAIYSTMTAVSRPNWMKPILSYLLKNRSPVLAKIMRVTRGHLVETDQYFQQARKVKDFTFETSDSWKQQGLDAVISPAFAFPPLPLYKGNNDLYWAGINYTAFYNTVNFPAGVVPVTKVKQEDLDAMADYPREGILYKRVHENMKGSLGLPVGVQVAALMYYDEMCLRVMKEIEDGLKA